LAARRSVSAHDPGGVGFGGRPDLLGRPAGFFEPLPGLLGRPAAVSRLPLRLGHLSGTSALDRLAMGIRRGGSRARTGLARGHDQHTGRGEQGNEPDHHGHDGDDAAHGAPQFCSLAWKPASCASSPRDEGLCALSAASFLASHGRAVAVRGFLAASPFTLPESGRPTGDIASLAGPLPTRR
jgi:hypothetical protein